MKRIAASAALALLLVMQDPVAAPGAPNAAEGCMNQLLFNGVWRAEVTSVEPFMDAGKQTGWQVTETWRNGTQGPLAPGDSALVNQTLELSSGSVNATDSTTGSLALSGLASNTFAPSGSFVQKQIFIVPNLDPANKPTGLLVSFDASKLAQMKTKPQFTTKAYDFHFKFGCNAPASSGASQAQGGSKQVDAKQGCLNEWLSNGVWKMRVTGLTPLDYGWAVDQEWTNMTNRKVFPGVLPSGPIVETNVGDEYLVTQGGTNASSANSAGDMQGLQIHPFAPGETFRYTQRFTWSGFDKNDKPVRLLVTFDAAKQNKLAGHPHYGRPANFRIDLECSK